MLDPLAERTRGLPLPVVRREVQRAWRSAFGGRLGEPGLTDCAEALRDGRHWSRGLWTDGWS
ncbi:MAG TPA: hypothetical protein VD813_04980 [Pseudonocardia sp.]|nr:hypothetical protein [Pseudonocardia sp.]